MPRIPKATLVAVVLVGLLTLNAGHANANHVACGDVITVDTTLDADLLNCPGDGLVIGADNVTLDLGGHTIDGDGVEGLYKDGIDNTAGHDGVTIRNGAVREFYWMAVALIETANNHVQNLTLSGGRQGTLVLDGFGFLDSYSNRIESNVFLPGGWIRMEGSNDNLITENSDAGMYLFASRGNRIERNLVQGFQLYESDSNHLTQNDVNGGILVINDSDENVIEKNLVSGGITIGGSYRGEPGGSKRNSVLGNDVHDSSYDGIFIQGPTDNPYYPSPGAIDTLVSGNTVAANSGDGIDVRAPGTTITENTANDNLRFGVRAVPGVIDGGGNTARGNGNSIQCLNVACGHRAG
jgi:parallel beta-helix repeat protein